MFGIGKKKVQHDERISQIFDSHGFKYLIEDGVFRFGYALDEGKTHTGIVYSETYEHGGIEYRDIVSPAFTTAENLDWEICFQLLVENQLVKIGAWRIVPTKTGNQYIAFAASIPADSSAEKLFATMLTVVNTSAAVEARLA